MSRINKIKVTKIIKFVINKNIISKNEFINLKYSRAFKK